MDGFLLINKRVGYTSREVSNQISRLLKTKKVGHIGTLDPFADGLLIVMVNKATKASPFIDDEIKRYRATILLGQKTDSGDTEGKVILEKEGPTLNKEKIIEVLNSFLGASRQIPPMTSAVHVNGVRLYELARKGVEIKRDSRPIYVHDISLVDYKDNKITFEARVSKGTYIRVLGEDIASKLNTVGHLISLTRLEVGPFLLDEAIDIDEINTNSFISIKDALMRSADVLVINKEEELDIKNGKKLIYPYKSENQRLLIINNDNEPIAMYTKNEKGQFVFKRGLF